MKRFGILFMQEEIMRHCCQFKADDIYYLKDNDISTTRILAIGFCPICKKPVAELTEYTFAGGINKVSAAGIQAQHLVMNYNSEILYSMKEMNYRKFKYKPFGWKFGVNKEYKNGKVYQYACDFYGNKELIKTI